MSVVTWTEFLDSFAMIYLDSWSD